MVCFLLRLVTAAALVGLACSTCSIQLVESMPQNMTYPAGSVIHPPTYKAWSVLISSAQRNLNISSFYWTLLTSDIPDSPKVWPSSVAGSQIFKQLVGLARAGAVRVSVVNNGNKMTNDLTMLQNAGAKVALLDVQRLLWAGILHTKMWTVDGEHGYVGSANMDWRSLTEVKEIGAMLFNCPVMVREMVKVQEVYKLLSGPTATIPQTWPQALMTTINSSHPYVTKLDGMPVEMFLSTSPPQFTPPGRSDDATTIVSIMQKAKKFIYVAVMDYSPIIVNYTGGKDVFWPNFDNALKAAAIDRSIQVRVLFSHWLHTSQSIWRFMHSLNDIGSHYIDLEVSYFEVPRFSDYPIPFSRVAHNKYMVTDNTAYIGTSNWSGDYFTKTCGVGLVVRETGPPNPSSLRAKLELVFLRDWNSPFARKLYIKV